MKTPLLLRFAAAGALSLAALAASATPPTGTGSTTNPFPGSCGFLACVDVAEGPSTQVTRYYCDFVLPGQSCTTVLDRLEAHAERPAGHYVVRRSCVPLQYCDQ